MVEKLTEKRDVPGSQVRALERVKDRNGLHLLAGAAADASSYEASRYGQGLLTYSLLLGMTGPASASNYGFAEGYVNLGFDEWLTIQNPTNSQETVNIFLVNNAGGYYATSVTVVQHSRYTVDITGMVIRSLYRAGEGFAGYEVSLDARANVLRLGRHRHDWELIKDTPCEVPVGRWVPLVIKMRIRCQESRSRKSV